MLTRHSILFLGAVLFFTFFPISSSGSESVAQKDDSIIPLSELDRNRREADAKTITELELFPVVTAFADSYASRIMQSNINLQKKLTKASDRMAAYNIMVQSLTAAYDIAASPSSTIAILDMTVMVTLERIVWEEFWYPKKFGDPAQATMKTLRQLEKQIWAIASKMLTSEQEQELLNMIQEWRKIHPDQQIVHSIRLSNFREILGMELKDPKGLFSGVRKAANTADDLWFLGERYRFLLTRLQMMLNFQLELSYMQMVNQPEMNQLLKDTGRVTESVEKVAETAAKLPETAQNLIQGLADESDQFRKLFEEAQQTLTVGNEMISLVNKTLDTIDSLVERFDPLREKSQGAEPIDIAEYREAAEVFTETARQLNLLAQSLDQLLAGPHLANRLSQLIAAVGQIKQESKGLIDHIFYRTILLFIVILIGIFFGALLYRYISIKLFDIRSRQSSP